MKSPCSPSLVVAILVHQQVNAFAQLFGCLFFAAYYAANTAPPCILHGRPSGSPLDLASVAFGARRGSGTPHCFVEADVKSNKGASESLDTDGM
jgi:hypothetical protein